jgi:hypothetical protein
MLWPTLIFIFGFVGLFFTTIFLTKDSWRWNPNTGEPTEVIEMENTGEYIFSVPI